MPYLEESFDLERLGQRLAELESEKKKLRRGPLCDFLGLIFFDVAILPDSTLRAVYSSPKGEERFGDFPETFEEALNLFHPDDKGFIVSSGDTFVRVRMLHSKTGKFNWYFIKSFKTVDRWVGVLFQANRVEGFGPGLDLSGVMDTERFNPRRI